METKPDLDGLRLAARIHAELSAWLSNEPEPRARDRQLWRAARVISGLGRELWAVRVWAAGQAALHTAQRLSAHNHDHIATALCWLAAHGTGGGWVDPGAGTTRCVPAEYLDAVYAFATAAVDAAGAPRFPAAPLYRRNAIGGQVWDAAFIAASQEWDGVLETGLADLVGLTKDGTLQYRECARNGQYILLAREMLSIARRVRDEAGQPRPRGWDIEEYSPGCWHAVPADGGAYQTREAAAAEAARRSDAALRLIHDARAAARAALGLPPEPRTEALDAIGATEDPPAPAATPAS